MLMISFYLCSVITVSIAMAVWFATPFRNDAAVVLAMPKLHSSHVLSMLHASLYPCCHCAVGRHVVHGAHDTNPVGSSGRLRMTLGNPVQRDCSVRRRVSLANSILPPFYVHRSSSFFLVSVTVAGFLQWLSCHN